MINIVEPASSQPVVRLADGYVRIRTDAAVSLAAGLDLPDDWRDRVKVMVLHSEIREWSDGVSGTTRAHVDEMAA